METGKFDKKIVDSARKNWNKIRGEFEFIMDYPPFVATENYGSKEKPHWGLDLTTDKGRKLINDFLKELKRVDGLIPNKGQIDSMIDPDVFSDPFAVLEKKFSSDLEEARLWQKRFPDDSVDACRKDALG